MLIKKQHKRNIELARKEKKTKTNSRESKRRVDTVGPERWDELNDKEESESAVELPIGATSSKKVSRLVISVWDLPSGLCQTKQAHLSYWNRMCIMCVHSVYEHHYYYYYY